MREDPGSDPFCQSARKLACYGPDYGLPDTTTHAGYFDRRQKGDADAPSKNSPERFLGLSRDQLPETRHNDANRDDHDHRDQEPCAEERCLPETLFPMLPRATRGRQIAPYAYLTLSAYTAQGN